MITDKLFKVCVDPECLFRGKPQYDDLDGFNGKYCRVCTNRNRRKKYAENVEFYREQKRRSLKKTADKVRVRKKKYSESFLKFESNLCLKLMAYEEIRRDPINENLAQVKCTLTTCGEWFNPTVTQASNRLKAINNGIGELNFYCSDNCKRLCPIYWQKGDFNFLQHEYDSSVNPEFRKMVLERDNYTCQKCGKSKIEHPDLILHCHHIDPRINNIIESCDLDNAATYCWDCHILAHQKDGCKYSQLRCS